MKEIKLPFLAKLALLLISVIALGYLANLGQSILAPLFFAFLLSLLFLPVSSFLEEKVKFSRPLSTFTSVLLMLIFLAAIIYFFSSQLSDFANDFPTLQKQVSNSFHDLQSWINRTFSINVDKQLKYLNDGLEKLLSSTGLILGFTLSAFTSTLAFFAFSVLFFIFILNYRKLLFDFTLSIFPSKFYQKVHDIAQETQKIIKQYISGLLIQILIVSILTSVLLSILGVKYAILLGVLTGLLNVIPYLGILISCLIACIISFATGGDKTLFVFLVYIGIHAVDANVTLPLVVGSKVKLNALFSFLALLIGEEIWGIAGMFLAIPLLAILKIVFDRIEGLEPYGRVLGEEISEPRKKRKLKIPNETVLKE